MTDGFTITRTFAAPRELVFELWTKPEHFSFWFGTAAIEVPLETLSMDVRVGGTWAAVMKLPDGNAINWAGDYVEITPPSRLLMTLTDRPDEEPRALITVDLVEVDGGTEMTMSQTGDGMTDEQHAQTIIGYNAFFDAMEEITAGQA
jgi:uncharacterized protein YndB with AHSA1/START domain